MPATVRPVLTIEFKINLLAPAKGQRFRMEGRVIKARTHHHRILKARRLPLTRKRKLIATMELRSDVCAGTVKAYNTDKTIRQTHIWETTMSLGPICPD